MEPSSALSVKSITLMGCITITRGPPRSRTDCALADCAAYGRSDFFNHRFVKNFICQESQRKIGRMTRRGSSVHQNPKMITLISIIALGFFLGMRHATDPDHVIAVTTIVSRQRSMRHAAVIGALWGVGHTITIFLVGSAIILFGVVIPPRLGLTMELSVGLMLILLGILNLSGIMRFITETFTPTQMGLHSHPHGHGDYVHNHPHGHNPEKHGHAEYATPVGWM